MGILTYSRVTFLTQNQRIVGSKPNDSQFIDKILEATIN